MPEFLPAMPHGSFAEPFENVFVVTGTWRFGPGFSMGRNMTVVRQGRSLVVINSVRLTEAGEAELEKLGTVEHVVRIGGYHGADDPYYVHRYRPTLWGPPRMRHAAGLRGEELREGSMPVEGAGLFTFERGKRPEAAIVLAQDGGVLVTCDSYQHWTSFESCSLLGGVMLRALGFGPTLIGKPWVQAMGRAVQDDFARLREREFRHLVPAHGSVLRDGARAGLDRAIATRFGG